MKIKIKEERKHMNHISFLLNGKTVLVEVKPSAVLLDVIRDTLQLKGTKSGCNEGECGACTVLVDGAPINSCLFLAVNAHGKDIVTIEGLTNEDGTLDKVQESLVQNGAVQCGFCTSGMALTIKGLLNEYEKAHKIQGELKMENPTREDIKKWLEGNLCRCTGYIKIIDSAEAVFEKKSNGE